MKFYNIFRYDFRYGFLSRPGKWAAVVFYGVFLFISFSFSLFHGFYGEVDSLWDINSRIFNSCKATAFPPPGLCGRSSPVCSPFPT